MSFFSKRAKSTHRAKIPPVGAWEHYSKKQNSKGSESEATKRGQVQIRTSSLSLSYDSRRVLDELSFCIHSGDYISIVGENGSGKTTLLLALAGLIKPTSGEIKLEGIKRNEIGYLPQINETELDFPATVSEVVISGCLARNPKSPFLPKGAKEDAFSAMEKLGITSLSSRSFNSLSGGQRQRVLLARAICAADKMLILDEPITGLDRSASADLYSLINDLNAKGMTVITVTHDINAAIKYSSAILYVSEHSASLTSVDDFKALPFALPHIEVSSEKNDTPYGDGGFRYGGQPQ